MTPKDHLVAARAKITQGWCRYQSALNRRGDPVDPKSTEAVCWCTLGALDATRPPTTRLSVTLAQLYLEAVLAEDTFKFQLISKWNDEPNRNPNEVLALFDRAIIMTEQHPTKFADYWTER